MSDAQHIFARIAPKPEFFDVTRDAILEIIPQTLAEPGCQAFVLHAGADDGCLYLYEVFDDEDALKAHGAQPYTRAVFARYEEWLKEPPRLTRMHRVS